MNFSSAWQIIADWAGLAHLRVAAVFGDRRGNALFVDIEAEIEFSFCPLWFACSSS